jgi:long-chain acyl-CoA synthetase
MNVASLFDRQALARPSALALTWTGGTLSYGELRTLALRMAALLAARGIGSGDRVAILLPNHHALPIAVLGAAWIGAVPVLLSPAWAVADAGRALLAADPGLCITTPERAGPIAAPLRTTLLVDPDDLAPVPAMLLSTPAVERTPAARRTDEPAVVLYSSGTTGDPKGVVLTHGNLVFNARAKIAACGIGPDDRLAMVVPMAHCFGLNVVLLGALAAGAGVRLFARFDAGTCTRAILDGETTMLFGPPTVFQRLLALGDRDALRRLRYGLAAAAPLPAGLADAWYAAAGWRLAQGYGLTESSPFATYESVASAAAGSVGRVIAGVEIRMAATEGNVGEILIRGPNVMAGYFRRPEATARVLRDGWLHTGDVGTLDDAGVLHLVGRLDDVVNVAGFKAWPSDVERILLAHPAVAEAAAFGVPDPERGAAVAAAVVLRAGAWAEGSEIAAYAADRLAGYQRPTRVHVVDVLPRGPAGKLLRRALGETFGAPPPAVVAATGDIREAGR